MKTLVTPRGPRYRGDLFHCRNPPVHKGARGSSVPATSTRPADIVILWHSVSKRSKKLRAPLAWGSARKPPSHALQSIRLAPGERVVGGRCRQSRGSRQRGFHQPLPAICAVCEMSKRESSFCIRANHPWGVRPPPTSREAFNEG